MYKPIIKINKDRDSFLDKPPLEEDEFLFYEKFINYDYVEGMLRMSIKREDKSYEGVGIRITDEISGSLLKVYIRKAQEELIRNCKDFLPPYEG